MASHHLIALASVLLATLAAAQTPTPAGATRTAPPRPARSSPVFEPGTSALLPAPESGPATRVVAGAAAGGLAFLSPSIHYSFQHGDDVPFRPGQFVTTSIHEVSPRLNARFAERITLAYTPTMAWYSDSRFNDGVTHNATFGAASVVGDVELHATQSFSRGSQVFLETAAQTKLESWDTEAGLGYPLGPRTQIDATANQRLVYTEEFNDTRTWSGLLTLRRKVSEDLSWNVGVGGSKSDASRGVNYDSRTARVGFRWEASSKITLDSFIGFEAIDFSAGDVGTQTEPRYSLTFTYEVTPTTQLDLSARRATEPSLFTDRFTDTSDLALTVRQRLLGKFTLSVEASRRKLGDRTSLASAASRDDAHTLFRVSIGGRLLERFPVSLSWQHRKSESTISLFERTGTMLGASIGWDY
jgi:hypothetical protein